MRSFLGRCPQDSWRVDRSPGTGGVLSHLLLRVPRAAPQTRLSLWAGGESVSRDTPASEVTVSGPEPGLELGHHPS